MIRILAAFALLAAGDAAQAQAVPDPCPALPGHTADVEVIVNGTARYGRLIVTGDGGVHLEHLDGEAQRWASVVIRRASTPSRGWDDRIDPVRCVWCRLGTHTALAEVHTPAASVVITRHQSLPSR
jgi:hypothetical protein